MAPDRQSSGSPSRKVLVLGSDSRSFLGVIRSLGRGGLTVDAAWTSPSSIARQSRYLRKVHDDLPAYSPDSHTWLDTFVSRVAEERYDLVIPTCDPAILPLQASRSELDPRRYYLLEDKAFQIANDKTKTYELALEESVPVPEQLILRSTEEAAEVEKRFGFPLVLKPASSFTLQTGNTRHYVQHAPDSATLRRILPSMLALGEIAVQKNFQGTGCGVEVLARDGRILACFQHLRIHEPLLGGGSSYRKSVPLAPELLQASAKLISAMNYTGVAMIEFRVDLRTGKFVLIEINGRFWGSLPLALAAGADFPLWLYQMWVEGREEYPTKSRTNLYCRNLPMDLDWFMSNLRPDRSEAAMPRVPVWKVAGELWHLITLRERFDTLVADDLSPAIAEFQDMSGRVTQILQKAFVAISNISIFRFFKRRRALRKATAARKMLFLCKGNICRSPFAAEYARKLLPDVEIASAGYYPEANRPSPPEAVAAAADFGVDLSSSRSKILGRGQLQQSDAVFVFDMENYLAAREARNGSASNVYFLGILDNGDPFIEDPYGESREDFVNTYTRIKSAIDYIVRARRGTR
jgi:protein-tyrosine-phosphatase/predicted ATP-grasp superfamily ATP-dependent carboligase